MIRIGFLVYSYAYGGSETELNLLIENIDKEKFSVSGIAPFKVKDKLLDHYPDVPVYCTENNFKDHRSIFYVDFKDAVAELCKNSDIIISWGLYDMYQYIPESYKGQIVLNSKDSGEWIEKILRQNVLLTKHYTANSSLSKTAFPKVYQDQVEIIHNGFVSKNPTLSKQEQKTLWGLNEKKIMGFMGRIVFNKGIRKIADTLSIMPDDWHAVFAGTSIGDDSEYFKQYCEQKIPGRYLILPWQDKPENVLNAFDLLIQPSEHEGFSNTLGEAWTLGIPTVYNKSSNVPQEFYGLGIELDPKDEPEKIKNLILNQDPILTIKAKKVISEFTIEKNIKKWETYLTKVNSYNKIRVMVVLSNVMETGVYTWIKSIMEESSSIDWCCLVFNRNSSTSDESLKELAKYSPVFDLGYKNFIKQWIVDGKETNLAVYHEENGMIDFRTEDDKEFTIEKSRVTIKPHDLHVYESAKNKLQSAIQYSKPDVIVTFGIESLSYILPKTSAKLISVSHLAAEAEFEQSAKLLMKYVSKRSTYNVGVSNIATNTHPKDNKNRTIYNGVKFERLNKNHSKEKLGFCPQEITIGFVGRLEKTKNPLPLAGAINLLPKHYRAAFIGKEGNVSTTSLKQISKKIIYFPHQPDINRFWNALDALVVTSTAEAFGLNIAEAWAAGIPVISTEVGIIKEIKELYGKDLAIVLPPNPNEYTLKNAIEKALSDPQYKQTVKICQELHNQYFNSKRMANEWELLIKSCRDDITFEQPQIPQSIVDLILSAPDLERIPQSEEKSKISQFIQYEKELESQQGCGCGRSPIAVQSSGKVEQYRDAIQQIKAKKKKKLL